jgi:fluoride exporter
MTWLSTALSNPILVVGIGGAVGSIARYLVSGALQSISNAWQVPLATTLVNIIGSLLLGGIAAVCKERTQTVYLLLGVGFCGGLTTFSTFSLELVEQMQKGRVGIAILECFINVSLGMLALYASFQFLQSK